MVKVLSGNWTYDFKKDINNIFYQVRGLTSWGRQRPLGRPAGIMPNFANQIAYAENCNLEIVNESSFHESILCQHINMNILY